MRTYDQMTLTERAEAHILSARQQLGAAAQNLQAAGNQVAGPPGASPGAGRRPGVLHRRSCRGNARERVRVAGAK